MARKKIASSVLIDTSALLALANPRDQYHTRAVAIAKRLVGSGSRLIGTVLILPEFQAHFLYLMGPARARAMSEAASKCASTQPIPVPMSRCASTSSIASSCVAKPTLGKRKR